MGDKGWSGKGMISRLVEFWEILRDICYYRVVKM